MEYFEIVSSPETVEIAGDSVYGLLYLRVGEVSFPYEDWGDLIDSCLAMWLSNVRTLCGGSRGQKVEFYFMDGPHYYLAEKKNETEILLSFYSYERVRGQATVELSNILQQIYQTSGKILYRLREAGEINHVIGEIDEKRRTIKQFLT